MPSLLAVAKAAGSLQAQRRIEAQARGLSGAHGVGLKSLVFSGPQLRPGVAGRPLQSREWLTEQAVDRYFKVSALVYRGVVALATAVGSVRWQVEVKSGDQWETDESHELQALLNQPHPQFNTQAINELMVMHLMLSGNTLLQKTAASGRMLSGAKKPRLVELIPLMPQGIDPVPDPEAWISRYEYKGPPRRIWQPDEILHIMLPNPGNLYWGMSPLQSIRKVVAMDLASVDWNLESMNNRAIADGVFTTKQALTTTQYEELKDQIWMQHQGPVNAHEPFLVGGDSQWQEMSRTPVEMDFNVTRMRTREEILSVMGLPPVVAGFFENATLANADASRRIFWEDIATPMYVERVKSGLNSSLVPHFGAPDKLRIRFDISGIPALRDDQVKKATTLQVLVNAGTPYNDAVGELEMDLPLIEGAGDLPHGLRTFAGLDAAAVDPDAPATNGSVAEIVGSQAPPTAPPTTTEQDVQVSEALVLNGAQITAATAIVSAVADGTIPRDAGLGQLQVLFNLTPEQAEQIMGSAGTDTPTTPNPKPQADTPPPPQFQPAEDEGLQVNAAKRPRIILPGRARKTGLTISTSVFATTVADQEAPALRRAFLAAVAKLKGSAKLEDLVAAVLANDVGAALQRLGAHDLASLLTSGLGAGIERTAARGADLAAEKLAADISRDLALDTSRLTQWLAPYLHERIAQLTGTTEAATREFFYQLATGKLGDNAEAAAALLRETFGLHAQQAAGVRNIYAALLYRGKTAEQALEAAAKLARARLIERATVVGEHESMVAANRGYGLTFEQAIAEGHVAQAFATWFSEQDDRVDDACASMDGMEIDLTKGERFVDLNGATWLEPPIHPGCRCGRLLSAVT